MLVALYLFVALEDGFQPIVAGVIERSDGNEQSGGRGFGFQPLKRQSSFLRSILHRNACRCRGISSP